MSILAKLQAQYVEMAKTAISIGGASGAPIYWNIDAAKEMGIKLTRSQRRYKVRDGEIIRFDSPRNVEKERKQLAPF